MAKIHMSFGNRRIENGLLQQEISFAVTENGLDGTFEMGFQGDPTPSQIINLARDAVMQEVLNVTGLSIPQGSVIIYCGPQ